MSTPDLTEILRQLPGLSKLAVRLSDSPASTSLMPRYPMTAKYAQLDQRTRDSYLLDRTKALQAEQAAVDSDTLPEPFDIQDFLGLQPRLRRFDPAAMARVNSRFLYYIQRLPPFDDLRKLYLARDGRSLLINRDMRAAQIKYVRTFRTVIAPDAALEGQLRLARRAPANPASGRVPRHHCYLVHHHSGVFNGAQVDSAIYFAQDHRAHLLVERQRRAQAEHRRLALAARQLQPRQYRRHSPVHARSWQPKLRSPQQCSLPRAKIGPSALPPSLPARLTSLPDPAAKVTGITEAQVSTNASTVGADHDGSDAASAASTVNLVATLMSLLRFVRSTLSPPMRRRYRTPDRHAEAQQLSPSAALERWPQTAPTLGRWTCAPRNCRKARSSLQLHHGSTDGTGTRPSFEPR